MHKFILMRRYFLIPVIALIASCNSNSEGNTSDKDSTLLSTSVVTSPYTAGPVDSAALSQLPTMDFVDTLHYFGSIHEGETVQHEFEFTNNGQQPLIISSAEGSCGCTVADYPRQPIAAGKSGSMLVTFSSAGKQGRQQKTITISTNTRRGMQMLYIKADVIPSGDRGRIPTE